MRDPRAKPSGAFEQPPNRERIARSSHFRRLPGYDRGTRRTLGLIVLDDALSDPARSVVSEKAASRLTAPADKTAASTPARAGWECHELHPKNGAPSG